jgi:predicted nucleic acid-binding protein
MADLFADTSGWGSIADVKQPFHALATRIYRDARSGNRRVVTTNYVLAELVVLMTSPFGMPRAKSVVFIDRLKASPYVEVVHVDPALDGEAWQLLKDRPDKKWSLVDCASFVVMQRRGITEALTTDHHFEQAGFARLLK